MATSAHDLHEREGNLVARAGASSISVAGKVPEVIELLDNSDEDDDGMFQRAMLNSTGGGAVAMALPDATIPAAARAQPAGNDGDDDDDSADGRWRQRGRRLHNGGFPEDGVAHDPALDVKLAAKTSNEIEILDGDRQPAGKNSQEKLPASPRARKRPPPEVQVVGPDGRLLPLETSVPMAAALPKTPLIQVLEIFPNVDTAFAKKLLSDHQYNIEVVVTVLSERDYPKEIPTNSTAGMPTSASQHHSSVVIQRTRADPKYDYSSASSFEVSAQYLNDAIPRLVHDFPFLKVAAVRRLFPEQKSRYSLARRHIQDVIVGRSGSLYGPISQPEAASLTKPTEEEEEEHYRLFRAILGRGRISGEVSQRLGPENCMKNVRKKSADNVPELSDEILKDEVYHFEQNHQQWMNKIQVRMRRKAARTISRETGSLVECGICCDDVAMDETIPCKDEGHLFCSECVVSLVETAVFVNGTLGTNRKTKKPAHEILCCHGGGCQSGFTESLLHKILPEKTWEKYSEMQANAAIALAGLGDTLGTCPKCGYQAFLADTEMIFTCPVEDCRFASCKKCGKEPHIPLRCAEVVQKKRQDEGRLKVEEALSEARIRICPKCKKKSIKSDGCNKITCACGMKFCYVCRAPLDKEGYSHFCQTAHCGHSSCAKCRLYTNDAQDDELAMKEAGITALERYNAEIQKEEGDNKAVDVQLDVDEMMHDPSNPQKRHRVIPALRVPVNVAGVPVPGFEGVGFVGPFDAARPAPDAGARQRLRRGDFQQPMEPLRQRHARRLEEHTARIQEAAQRQREAMEVQGQRAAQTMEEHAARMQQAAPRHREAMEPLRQRHARLIQEAAQRQRDAMEVQGQRAAQTMEERTGRIQQAAQRHREAMEAHRQRATQIVEEHMARIQEAAQRQREAMERLE